MGRFDSTGPTPILTSSLPRLTGALVLFGLLLVTQPSIAPAQFAPDTPSDLRAELERADEMRIDGQLHEVMAKLRSLQDEHPTNIDVRWRIVINWVDLSTEAEDRDLRREFANYALQAADAAHKMDPFNAWVNVTRAVAAGQVSRFASSTREQISHSRDIKIYADRALEIDPELALAYHLRGRWHREVSKLGFMQRAVVSLVYGGLPGASIEEAVENLRRATELEQRAFHHLELGRTYMEMRRHEDARREFRKALEAPHADPFDSRYKQEAQELLDRLR